MPDSTCGSWPAFWTVGPSWPNNGEIDIIEGVNTQNTDFMTLHTSPGCAVSNGGNGQLQPYSQDCNTAVNGNAGCSFHATDTTSYGTGFDNNGGGIYAMEWTSSGISIWFWSPSNPAPSDVLGDAPNPAGWGIPAANWAGSGCDWDSHFASHQIIFDHTFCGDWAGAVFATDSTCAPLASSCTDYVANNPGAYANTYWSVDNLKVYQNNPAKKRDLDASISSRAANTTAEQIAKCQAKGLCKRDAATAVREPTTLIKERAAASQAAPSDIPEASRTLQARAAASQAAPSDIPKASRTAVPRGKDGKRAVDNIGSIRRKRYEAKLAAAGF